MRKCRVTCMLHQTKVAAHQAHFDYHMRLYQLELASGLSLGAP